MVQNTVDLYSKSSPNEEVFEVTDHIEKSINKVFELLDRVKEANCKLN